MEDPKVVEACAHLTEKFLGSQPYEALQYVQSFVARKMCIIYNDDHIHGTCY